MLSKLVRDIQKKILNYGEMCLSIQQFKVFRKLVLDEFAKLERAGDKNLLQKGDEENKLSDNS